MELVYDHGQFNEDSFGMAIDFDNKEVWTTLCQKTLQKQSKS
jgi:hypothetical protein